MQKTDAKSVFDFMGSREVIDIVRAHYVVFADNALVVGNMA